MYCYENISWIINFIFKLVVINLTNYLNDEFKLILWFLVFK